MCELKQESQLIRKRRQSKNGQGTYRISMNTQFGGCVNQTHKVPNRVTMPISRLQMVYTTLIMIT
jgi:hypothetical protein